MLGILHVSKFLLIAWLPSLYSLCSLEHSQLIFAVIGIVAASLQTSIGGLTAQSVTMYVIEQYYDSLSLNNNSSIGAGMAALTDILLTVLIVSVATKWKSVLEETNS